MFSEMQSQPVATFSWDINCVERSLQVRRLLPLLDQSEGYVWFLERLNRCCTWDQAWASEVFHLCFRLRDILLTTPTSLEETHDRPLC